jgi:methionyl aminopeptidase
MAVIEHNDIEGLRRAGRSAAIVLMEMINHLKPGMSALKLDELAGAMMNKLEIHSAPRQHQGFPAYTCISVNDIIAHGVPGRRIFRCGDMINIDVAVEKDGFFSDVGYTLVLGSDDALLNTLCTMAREATMKAIDQCRAGNAVNAIGGAIENHVRSAGFTVIKNLCSHGIGRSLHQHPLNVYNYYDPDASMTLEPGMAIAIEPYISNGACRAIEHSDGWSLTTHNKSRVAQFEHTVLVTEDGPEVMTLL